MRRLPTFGLRFRMIASLLAASALPLLVAALALLPPLENRLRQEDLESLTQATIEEVPDFEALDASDLVPHSHQVRDIGRSLERRTGARVIVFDGRGRKLADTDPQAAPDGPRGGSFDDVVRALATGRRVRSTRSGSAAGQARVAEPVRVEDRRLVVALRRSLEETSSAAKVVRRAFLVAAVAGLVAALVLGVALATTLVRRLRRLRDVTRRVAAEGPQVELPRDRGRDEVGELTRGFAAMQMRLRQQEGVRRAFVATASHELRTPLASLQAMLELLDDDLASEPPDLDDARPRVTAARTQSMRLTALANDLLELTRLDSDVALRTELVELGEIGRAVIGEFEGRAAERRVRIALIGAERPNWVLGDPDSIARVVRILIDNALTFSPPGELVTVTAAAADSTARVEVADVGPGVPADERQLIFERFKRGSASGSKGGFGLGLAIGRELVERMDGELRLVDSEVGARFALLLPLAPFPDGEAGTA
jgi:signal transduction histidine kinase